MRRFILTVFSIFVCLAVLALNNATAAYDPLHTDGSPPEHKDFVVKDVKRSREIPIRVYFPEESRPAPVVLFSHGLGGAREGNAYLGSHWALRGYVAVFLQHPGSDASVWQDQPMWRRPAALKRAASPGNLLLRAQDASAVLDQLERWNAAKGSSLYMRLDLKRIGMSGHSFGALTTQALTGQTFARSFSMTDARIKAAVLMSPSPPGLGDPEAAFHNVRVPWLLMTGTKDNARIVHMDAKSRLTVFPALPPGGKYELVLSGAEHSAFTDRALPGDVEKRNPNHHRAILAITTAFWDAFLRESGEARRWLDSDEARSVLEKDDAWLRK